MAIDTVWDAWLNCAADRDCIHLDFDKRCAISKSQLSTPERAAQNSRL